MPIYEYECTQCHERSEIIQRLSDPPYTHCPKCGGEVKKLISAPAIQFKGTGWYKTDYASASSSKAPETKSDSSTKSEAAGSPSSSDKKPQTKAD
jgi:putative FmdB family regulatory protein